MKHLLAILFTAAALFGQGISVFPPSGGVSAQATAPPCNTNRLWLDTSSNPSVLKEARACPGSWTAVSGSAASVTGYGAIQVYDFAAATSQTILGSTHGLGTSYAWLMQTTDGTYFYPANTDNVRVTAANGDMYVSWTSATAVRILLLAGGHLGFRYVEPTSPGPTSCATGELWLDTTRNTPRRCTAGGTPGTWADWGASGWSDDGTTLSTTRSVSMGTTLPLGAPTNSQALAGNVYLPNSTTGAAIAYGFGAPSGTPTSDLYIDATGGAAWINAAGIWRKMGTPDYYVDVVAGNDASDGRTEATALKSLHQLEVLGVPATDSVAWKAANGYWIPAPPWTGLLAQYDFVQGVDAAVLYDKSGNAANGTFGAAAAAPAWVASGLSFDGGDYVTLAINNVTARTFASVLTTTGSLSPQIIVGTSNNLVYDGYNSGYFSSDSYGAAQKSIFASTRRSAPVVMVSSRGTALMYGWLDGIKSTITVAGAPATVNITKVGSRNANDFNFTGIFHDLLIYNRVLSDAEYMQFHQWAASVEAGLARSVTVPTFRQLPAGEVIFAGDSLTYGTGASTAATTYPAVVAAALPELNAQNVGVSGYKISDLATDQTARLLSKRTTAYRKQVMVVWAGTNDLNASVAPATAYANIVSVCQALQAAGFKVIVLTAIKRDSAGLPGTFEADRGTLNASIVANWATFADKLVNVGAAAEFQNTADTTYYNADKVHLTDAGYVVVAGLVETAIRSLY